jgi:hypothetical protein
MYELRLVCDCFNYIWDNDLGLFFHVSPRLLDASKYSILPSGPVTGENERPATEYPSSKEDDDITEFITSSWTPGSFTTPFFPTLFLPASNCGFTRHTTLPKGFSIFFNGGSISFRDMK